MEKIIESFIVVMNRSIATFNEWSNVVMYIDIVTEQYKGVGY